MKALKPVPLFAALLALLVAVLPVFPAEAASGTVTPESIYKDIEAAGVLPDMVMTEEADISSKYGIELNDLSGFSAAEAKSSLKADEVVIMKAKNPSAKTRITKALETVLEERKSAVKQTSSLYKTLQNGSVSSNGMYVYLVISDSDDEIKTVIADAIKPGSGSALSSGSLSDGDTAGDDGCVGDGLVW